MTTHPTFDARITREDNLWVVVIDGPLPEGSVAATDTVRFADVDTETRDLIADLTDLDEDQFRVRWHYALGGADVTAEMLRFEHAQLEYRETTARQHDLQIVRDRARDAALAKLSRAGVSQRVMSEMVGVSQQRVNQLLRGLATGDRHAPAS